MLPALSGGSARSRRPSRHQQQQPLAEVRVRELNLQQQLRLVRAGAKFERDRGVWTREDDKRRRGVLLDLAKMLDARLTPSVDDWFTKRRIRQASRLDYGDDGEGEPSDGDRDANSDEAAAAASARRQDATDEELRLERARLLEMKRSDWCGVTSVGSFAVRFRQRRQEAGADSELPPPSAKDGDPPGPAERQLPSLPLTAAPGYHRHRRRAKSTAASVASHGGLGVGVRPKTTVAGR